MEAYYQQAARVAGATPQTSLSNTLSNTTVVAAMAANTTACSIMGAHYKSDISSYNSSKFTDAFNLFAYRCKAKTYLFRGRNGCDNITGGWNWINNVIAISSSYDIFYIDVNRDTYYTSTKGKINFTGFSSLKVNVSRAGDIVGDERYANFNLCLTDTKPQSNSSHSGSVLNYLEIMSASGTGVKTGGVTSGSYYIRLAAYGIYNANVSQIWIE